MGDLILSSLLSPLFRLSLPSLYRCGSVVLFACDLTRDVGRLHDLSNIYSQRISLKDAASRDNSSCKLKRNAIAKLMLRSLQPLFLTCLVTEENLRCELQAE